MSQPKEILIEAENLFLRQNLEDEGVKFSE